MAKDWVKINANMFWESSFNHWLKPRLNEVYTSEKGIKTIKRWLRNRDFVITLKVKDFNNMDPAHLLLFPDGFDMVIGGNMDCNISVTGEKSSLIIAGADFYELIKSIVFSRINVKVHKATFKDLFYIIRLLYI